MAFVGQTEYRPLHSFSKGVGGEFVLPVFRVEMLLNFTDKKLTLATDFYFNASG